jgi:hypothetical protein
LFQERFDEIVREETHPAGSDFRRHEQARTRMDGAVHPPRRGSESPLKAIVAVLVLVACMVLNTACGRVSKSGARQLVEKYNEVVSEAYRRGDVRLIDPVVGPDEGKKITGLIGVRSDMGLTMDSHLLSLDVTGCEQSGTSLRVHTREKWKYRNLQIGTGRQAGNESEDNYEMTYYFIRESDRWLVNKIEFATPPLIGSTNGPWTANAAAMHGMPAKEEKP